jgi:hypothetical protein
MHVACIRGFAQRAGIARSGYRLRHYLACMGAGRERPLHPHRPLRRSCLYLELSGYDLLGEIVYPPPQIGKLSV